MAVIITVGIEDLLAEGTLEPRIGSGFSTQLILVGPVSTHGLQHLGGRARERVLLHGQALPSRGSSCRLHSAPNGAVVCTQHCV